jgi:CDP-4-dehydro-6-deoxyglucose reductase
MSFKVVIEPSNLQFIAPANETLLNAALSHKLNLPHGCKNGDCAACKCKINSGTVNLNDFNPRALTTLEIEQGFTLLCKAYPNSDLTLELPGFNNNFPIKTLPAKIESIDKHGTVAVIKLKLPANQRFDFYAGQYIDIIYAGKNRSYSIANSPTNKGIIELHIRYRRGGIFSAAVWEQLNPGQILRFKGPLGNFTLSNTKQPILMVCSGTGFAPIKSILEYMLDGKNERLVHLIWANYTPDDFYLTELLHQWQQTLKLKLTLCVDANAVAGYFQGLVTTYIEENFPTLQEYEVYACGNPSMIASLYQLATQQLHLEKANFYSDIFTPST